MKSRNGYISNSSSSSFILAPKPEHRADVIQILESNMGNENEWMGVWYCEVGSVTIAGGESCVFAVHEVWLSHPEWFNSAQLEQDEWSIVWKLDKGKWLRIEPDWSHAVNEK